MENAMKLKITCKSDPDLNGTWDQHDVEDEIRDVLGLSPQDDTWIEYVINHLFNDFATSIDDATFNAIMSDNVQSIVFKTNENDIVKLEKLK